MFLSTLTPTRPLRWWWGMLLAIGLTLVAGAGRAGAEGLLGTNAPYLIFIAAVLLSAVVGGRTAGALAAVLGGLIANLSIGGASHLEIRDSHLWNLVLFLLVSGVIVLVAGTMSAALRREARLADELAVVSREYQHRVTNVLTMGSGPGASDGPPRANGGRVRA